MDSGVWKPTIYSQGRALGKLAEGRFFGVSVPPGTFYFSFTDKPKPGREGFASVMPGQRVFIELGLNLIENFKTADLYQTYQLGRPITSPIFNFYSICTLGA